ncbi:MAG: hypothetical protein HC816_00175 [Leptolyngbyaceae cyanobacterium RM1_1_2]|nr:hypothetical protein [Leptolyngbyaceae cyanobacterium RM1_1_2]
MNIRSKFAAAAVVTSAALVAGLPAEAATVNFSFDIPASFTPANPDSVEQGIGSITFDELGSDTNGIIGIAPSLPFQQFLASDFQFSLFGETIGASQGNGSTFFVYSNGVPQGVSFANGFFAEPFINDDYPILSLSLLQQNFVAFNREVEVVEGSIRYSNLPGTDVPEPAAAVGLLLMGAAGRLLKQR